MQKFLKILASPGLTIILLLLLILLVTIGTLEQTQIGLYRAQQEYFHAILSFFPSGDFILKIPFPGGTLLFGLLLVNLIAVFIAKFKKRWDHSGLWLCHLGLVALIVGSFITFVFSEEGIISIEQQKKENEFASNHEVELVLMDTTSPQYNQVAIFSQNMLKKNAILVARDFPFTIQILAYHSSCFAIPKKEEQTSAIPSLGKYNFELHPIPNREEGCTIALFVGEKKLAEFASMLNISVDFQHTFGDNERKFTVLLRKKTSVLPFQITLKEFSPEFYPGTQTPRSFESHVAIIDGELQREATIRMNRPLRYRGYTFYQNSYSQKQHGYTSILAVVHNPGELWPYFSCIFIFLGMVIHFIIKIGRFLRHAQ